MTSPNAHQGLPTDYLRRGNYEIVGACASYEEICKLLGTTSISSVIAIDGPSNSGKTSLAESMANFYKAQGVDACILPLDFFLVNRETRAKIHTRIADGSLDIAGYSAIAWRQDSYEAALLTIKNIINHATRTKSLQIHNVYNRNTGASDETQSITVGTGSIIITEGVGLHTYHADPPCMTVRVDASDDVLLGRVLNREKLKPSDSRMQEVFLAWRFEAVDRLHTDYLRFVSPFADFVVDTSDFNKMLVYRRRCESINKEGE
jgi:uridine kinase